MAKFYYSLTELIVIAYLRMVEAFVGGVGVQTDLDRQPKKELDPTTRVVVTYMGATCSLGLNINEIWSNIIAGRSGIRSKQFTKYPQISASVAGIIPEELDIEKILDGVLPKKEIRHYLHRSSQLSIAASLEALVPSGLLKQNRGDDAKDKRWIVDEKVIDPSQIATIIATGIGGGEAIDEVGKRLERGLEAKPQHVLHTLPERVVTPLTKAFGFKGPSYVVIAACAGGNYAITSGVKEIMLGEATVAVVGASESALIPIAYSMFDCVRALDREPDPSKAPRPFDKSAGGFVMGEGAAILVLERLDFARRRGATILAEISGFGNSADAYHDTRPSGEGAVRAMRIARGKAKSRGVTGPIYINAHATGTDADPIEMNAIKEVYGDQQKYVLGISATKSSTGHLLGAAGAIEAVISIKALQTGILPPTLRLENPIDEAEGWNLVPNDAQNAEITQVSSNGFGFGGLNSTVDFSKY